MSTDISVIRVYLCFICGSFICRPKLQSMLRKNPRESSDTLVSASHSPKVPVNNFNQVRCETGYLCDVCSGDVENIWDSDLYLRYVIGQVDPETLHTTRERHIRCNPTLAQFIVDPDFEPVTIDGPFDKRQLDVSYVREQERLITRGWRRLKELAHQEGISLLDYPLPEVRRLLEQK